MRCFEGGPQRPLNSVQGIALVETRTYGSRVICERYPRTHDVHDVDYIMQRTQISLTEGERRSLDEAVARTGRSLSALIRDAVEQVYGSERSTEDDLAAMRRAFGSWTPRLDGADWVERQRSGLRLVQRRS